MSLVSQITSIVSQLYPAATFTLSSKFYANIQSSDLTTLQMPLIVLDNELSKTSEIKKNNNVQKDTRIVISFLQADTPGNTDLQSEEIRAAMEAMADRVAVQIYQILEVRPIGNQKYKLTPLFHIFSTDLTGVTMEMQVNYNEIVNFKLPEEEPEEEP